MTELILLRGAGDLGSGVAYRLHKAGYTVVLTELPAPLLVRRAVSFGNAVYEGSQTVEDVTARVIHDLHHLKPTFGQGEIPLLIDAGERWRDIGASVVIDTRMAKRNLDTTIQDAPFVIALGPGFVAGEDCHAVIETNRGHRLGRVIWQGTAEPNTGIPGNVKGHSSQRVLRAPTDGHVHARFEIGDKIEAGSIIATVNNQPVAAPFDGVLRGLIHPDVAVWAGLKIGDVDPRGIRAHCFEISDKSLAVGGGVLEALLTKGIIPEAKAHAPG